MAHLCLACHLVQTSTPGTFCTSAPFHHHSRHASPSCSRPCMSIIIIMLPIKP
jgi:hypothetical protein